MDTTHLGAVILAGGSGDRIGGVDKPMLDVGGQLLLGRAVGAFQCGALILTGTPRPGFERYRWIREDPPGSGPTAALAAGLGELDATVDPIGLLAADLIGVTERTVRRLCDALGAADGAVLTDAAGYRQWVISVWRARALRAAMPADPAGVPLRAVLGTLRVTEVPELPGESDDIDTPVDLANARAPKRR